MDVWNSLLGCAIGLVGAFVIAAYTRLNSRMRAKGARAHWAVGALTGSIGMASMFCGWALLGLAEPVFWTPWLQIPGDAACVLALAVYAISARQVGRLRGPTHYSLDLKTSGIYNRVRHPQALALCILAVGWALLSGSLPYLITLPLWIGFWTAYTYLEEKYELIPAFGEKYLRYRNETPRILPRLFSQVPLLVHPRNAPVFDEHRE
jgi:protein-S-isoprenylcysteine O-methyltransferase Ste14